jgi:hypothetical protein
MGRQLEGFHLCFGDDSAEESFALHLVRLAQWRPRIATSKRVNQLLQRLLDTRLSVLDARSPRAGSTHSPGHLDAVLNLTVTVTNRLARQPSPVAPETSGSPPKPIARDSAATHRRPARSSGHWRDSRVFLNGRRFQGNVSLHLDMTSQPSRNGNVIYAPVVTSSEGPMCIAPFRRGFSLFGSLLGHTAACHQTTVSFLDCD